MKSNIKQKRVLLFGLAAAAALFAASGPGSAAGLQEQSALSLKDTGPCACARPIAAPVQAVFAGDPLSRRDFADALTVIVTENPALAADVICAVQQNPHDALVLAAAKALAMADLALAGHACGGPVESVSLKDGGVAVAAGHIAAALHCAHPAFQTAYHTSRGTGCLTHLLIPFIRAETGGGVVSPSRP